MNARFPADRSFDPRSDDEPDQYRVVAVALFLMLVAEDPLAVPGAVQAWIGERTFTAKVPGAGVSLLWLVGDDHVLVAELADLRSGRSWRVR